MVSVIAACRCARGRLPLVFCLLRAVTHHRFPLSLLLPLSLVPAEDVLSAPLVNLGAGVRAIKIVAGELHFCVLTEVSVALLRAAPAGRLFSPH